MKADEVVVEVELHTTLEMVSILILAIISQ
jgi:hypothetical protein